MTIPHLPININLNANPTIYEQQTTGRLDLQNRADIGRGNVVITPQSDADLIPFSKLAERNTWNYRSEADRPSLPPVFTTRGSGATFEERIGTSKENYDALHDQLPEGLKADMAKYPTPLTVALESLLKSLAEGVTWQQSVTVMLTSENAAVRQQVNQNFPNYTFTNTIAMGNELVASADQLLSEIGQNDPHHLEVKAFVDDIRTHLSQVTGE